jgi:drug/metabolite transporter (DMT)-like permease
MQNASAAGLGRANKNPAVRGALFHLALAIAAISFTPIFFRLSEIGPTATAFYRTGLAIPFFVLWTLADAREARRRGSLLPAVGTADAFILVAGGAVFAVNIVAYAWAVHLTSVADASLLSNLSPIFVALGGFILFRERVGRGFVGAMITAIAGVALLTSDRLSLSGSGLLGDAFGIGSAICFAAYLLIVGRLRLRLGSATIMLWTGGVGALVLLAASLGAGERLVASTAAGWSALIGLAVVSYALGQGLLTTALARLGASFSAVSLLALPVIAALLGWACFGETLSATEMLGGIIVLGSILAAGSASRAAAPRR